MNIKEGDMVRILYLDSVDYDNGYDSSLIGSSLPVKNVEAVVPHYNNGATHCVYLGGYNNPLYNEQVELDGDSTKYRTRHDRMIMPHRFI